MTVLGQAVTDYLALRRSLGYKLEAHHRLLPQFVEFLDQRNELVITTALALEWATQPAGSAVWWHQRLAVVVGVRTRAFALQQGRDTRVVPRRKLDHDRRAELAQPREKFGHRNVA